MLGSPPRAYVISLVIRDSDALAVHSFLILFVASVLAFDPPRVRCQFALDLKPLF
jgi:hypothetical protein